MGKITDFFGRRTPAVALQPAIAEDHWIHRLQLKNPHNLCYVNASLLALVFVFDRANLEPAPLSFLLLLMRKAAGRPSTFHLVQSLRFRNLTPAWDFDAGQQDAAEYLHALLQAQPLLDVSWDTRCETPDGVRLREDHRLPIRMHVSTDSTLQQVIRAWHGEDDVQALISPSTIVCVQLGRYTEAGKSFAKVTFSDQVLLPVFTEGLQVSWHPTLCKPLSSI